MQTVHFEHLMLPKSHVLIHLIFADKTVFGEEYVPDLERWIDEYSEQLPPLKNFILPVS